MDEASGGGRKLEKAWLIRVTGSSDGVVLQDRTGKPYGRARITYVTKANEVRRITAMARGAALEAARALFEGGSYAGPAYGVFATDGTARKFSVINLQPAPSMRGAAAA